MRKLGIVLSVLGGFLVSTALIATFYAPGQVERTPLDVDSKTLLEGEAQLGDDPSFPVKATSLTRTDSAKSTDDVVVWVSSSCLMQDVGDPPDCVSVDDPQERLISASIDNFATDRHTGLAVNDPDLLPADAEAKEGLVNKWPFNAEKKSYPYWDGTAGAVQTAEYDGEETVEGIETYRYRVVVDDAPIEITDGVDGTYSSEKMIWIEPTTGSIVNQTDSQERVTDEGDNFLTLDLAFTDDQVKQSVADANDNKGILDLVTTTIPLIGFLAGIPLLIAGIALTVLGGRRTQKA